MIPSLIFCKIKTFGVKRKLRTIRSILVTSPRAPSALQIINERDKYGVDFDISSDMAFNNDQTLALLQGVLNSGK